LFAALAFWLVGSMLYIWLIALIFHRIVFLPLSPGELTPPYWINMGQWQFPRWPASAWSVRPGGWRFTRSWFPS
jgi:hypothetical protein